VDLNRLGEMQLEQGRIGEADKSFHQALTILDGDKTGTTFNSAAVLNNLAVVQQATGNFFKSAALMRKAVGILEANPSAEERLGAALSNLAAILLEMGAQPEAMNAAERAVAILNRYKDSELSCVSLITLVDRPGDSFSGDAAFGIGVGPADGARTLGIGTDVLH
jgi:tetratricopeptide (TPR) repeat protein